MWTEDLFRQAEAESATDGHGGAQGENEFGAGREVRAELQDVQPARRVAWFTHGEIL
jgi:hypothetical protein